MRTVFLVPRRGDGGPRDALWAYCQRRWGELFPDVGVFEGHHEQGAFNRSAAINTAAATAGDWDLAIVIDADVMLRRSQVAAAIETAAATGRVTWAHRRWRGVTQDWTERIVADKRVFGPEFEDVDLDILVERTTPISWSCCFVIPRGVWDSIGGFDERFVGWGFEDMAFQSLICGLYGHERIEGDVIHLWHPRSEERIVKGQPALTASPEYITNARLGRRYMVALRRDHQQHDRPGGPSDEAERMRDIANLKRDDERLAPIARRMGLPDWSAWWPTLEELRDGARSVAWQPRSEPTVSIVVQTGGKVDAWHDRRGYLERSLASLNENVTGPIVQRVVYDCWGDAGIRTELEVIAAPFGFYVVGPTVQEMSRVADSNRHAWSRSRFWQYVGRRAIGEFVFGTEDDFIYDEPVDLADLAATLIEAPHLRQVALLRGPYFPREIEAGGVIESLSRAEFEPIAANGHSRIEHRDHFTNNPSLFRRQLAETTVVPPVPNSEHLFARSLLRDRQARFAYWGDGRPMVTHIGAVRAGSGY